ncbi:MAG: glutamine--tRNA ligase/YqeY domain fusion protein [Clostridiales bacterium]|nr:glutamine--tRNA ligase/YqeY domain fusion protein [Clostridiales bacterium]
MEDLKTPSNFIKKIIVDDLESGKHKKIVTRFPPEPNGYIHIGHAKAIIINFDLADEFGGETNLRFDDTNPIKEDVEYVDSIMNDIKWLGYEWDHLYYASDYFDEMYERAVLLIKKGLAYVDDSSADEISEQRGTLTQAGVENKYRNRTVEENMDLFTRMKNGEFEDGVRVLRAKIDMSSPNMNMRDPVIYRITHKSHHQTGDKWCIYPMYDYAHPLEDAIEGITHSLCSLEFEDHRPLYDWVVDNCEMEAKPRQIEFARLEITNTVMSKRKLKLLVDEKVVDGWDDPRLPTISGLRRRGYTPDAIKVFARAVGVSKSNSLIDNAMLEHFIREDLKLKVMRTMAVINPLKVTITNYDENEIEWLEAENNQENEEMGTRLIPFSNEIYIEQDDFAEEPPKKWKRLFLGGEVRLKNAYFIKCNEIVKDESGEIVELKCTYDAETKSGSGFNERKPNGTIHWVEAKKAIPAEFRVYDSIINDQDAAEEDKDFLERINSNSLVVEHGFIEENMKDLKSGDAYQFFRHGYFAVDSKDTSDDNIVFNLIVSLKSSFKMK